MMTDNGVRFRPADRSARNPPGTPSQQAPLCGKLSQRHSSRPHGSTGGGVRCALALVATDSQWAL